MRSAATAAIDCGNVRSTLDNVMAPTKRAEVIGIRMDRTESAMLRELAALDGLTSADVVRLLVRREYARRVGPPPTTSKG